MFGTGELIILLLVVLILFGGKRLPELARSLGQGVREFKKACHGLDDVEIIPKERSENERQGNTKKESAVIEIDPDKQS